VRGILAAADGFLPVDKPSGPSSHDVVTSARRALGTRRIGHTGTLDPFASGLLLLCVERATRLAEYLHELPKSYEAVARLGQVTTTLDPEGEVTEERPGWERLGEEEIRGAMAGMLGRQEQLPPAFSAKKVGGEAAYRRARRGEAVELRVVGVEIHRMELLELDLPRIRFAVTASTGTYVRALARDLGEALGTVAHLVALRRTAIGPFSVEDAVGTHALENPARVQRAWIHPLEALGHFPRVDLAAAEARRLQAGQAIPLERPSVPAGRPVAVAAAGELLAVATLSEGVLRPVKVFPRE
jgi:tRNA pseudouridine55 synthase